MWECELSACWVRRTCVFGLALLTWLRASAGESTYRIDPHAAVFKGALKLLLKQVWTPKFAGMTELSADRPADLPAFLSQKDQRFAWKYGPRGRRSHRTDDLVSSGSRSLSNVVDTSRRHGAEI